MSTRAGRPGRARRGALAALGVVSVAAAGPQSVPGDTVRWHPRAVALIGTGACGDVLARAGYLKEVTPPNFDLGTLGWNAGRDVVGTRLVSAPSSSSPSPAPFVSLREDVPGGPPAGLHALADGPGFAWDISDQQVIVGGLGGTTPVPSLLLPSGLRAVGWNAGGNGGAATPSGMFTPVWLGPPGAAGWSMALAVADGGSATPGESRIVGLGATDCDGSRVDPIRFSWGSSPQPIAYQFATPNGGDCANAAALRWATSVTEGGLAAGGFDGGRSIDSDDPCAGLSCEEVCGDRVICGATFSSPTTHHLRANCRGTTTVRSITPTGDRVAGGFWCRESEAGEGGSESVADALLVRPLVWSMGSNCAPDSLPVIGSGLNANAIVQRVTPGPPSPSAACGADVAVGWSHPGPAPYRGLVWNRVTDEVCGPDEWQVRHTDALLATPSAVSRVLQTYDASPDGRFLALAFRETSGENGEVWAVELVPVADLDLDGRVNGSDLGLWLQGLGQGGFEWIEHDLDADGLVSAVDLGVLLAFWTGNATYDLSLGCGDAFCPPNLDEAATAATAARISAMSDAVRSLGFETTRAWLTEVAAMPRGEAEAEVAAVREIYDRLMEDPR